jgi:AIPR protein
VNLYKKEREKLFAYNIRSYMGKKGINRDIIETARNSAADFYYFNNGVSAICTDYSIDEDNVLEAYISR